jgi:hypothetical protein
MASTAAPRFAYVKKITTALCGVSAQVAEQTALNGDGEEVPVLRIGGRITGSEPGKTAISDYIKFKGEFEAINAVTDQHYRSQSLIVPPVAEQMLSDLSSNGEEVTQFGLDITVVKNDSAKGGYKFRYGVRSLTSPKVKDALSQLMDSFDAAIPLLPAPKSDKKAKK